MAEKSVYNEIDSEKKYEVLVMKKKMYSNSVYVEIEVNEASEISEFKLLNGGGYSINYANGLFSHGSAQGNENIDLSQAMDEIVNEMKNMKIDNCVQEMINLIINKQFAK